MVPKFILKGGWQIVFEGTDLWVSTLSEENTTQDGMRKYICYNVSETDEPTPNLTEVNSIVNSDSKAPS